MQPRIVFARAALLTRLSPNITTAACHIPPYQPITMANFLLLPLLLLLPTNPRAAPPAAKPPLQRQRQGRHARLGHRLRRLRPRIQRRRHHRRLSHRAPRRRGVPRECSLLRGLSPVPGSLRVERDGAAPGRGGVATVAVVADEGAGED